MFIGVHKALSEIAIRIPRELEVRLEELVNKIVKETYGEALLSSIKSYIDVEEKDRSLVELLLYNPRKLVNYLAKVFSESENAAYNFLKTILDKLYNNIGEIPEIDINEALNELRIGNEEKIQTIVLELAYKLRVKAKKPLF